MTDNVDLDWLRSITPRIHPDYCKFTINKATNKVCVGMDIHRDCEVNMGDESELLGGNIYFDDGHIVYESTLNIPRNLKSRNFRGNPRIVTDPDIIAEIDSVLKARVEL